jgi:hypothetical protein
MNRMNGVFIAGIALCFVNSFALAETNGAREKSVPLCSIVTTSPQPNVKAFEVAFPDETQRRKMFQQISAFSGGASNLFLVDATNPLDAFKATLSVLQGSHSAETPAPVNTAEPKRGSYWLVVYLGVGPSQPVWWVVESATIARSTIRLSYHQPKANIVTRDVWRFYYWVPLEKLPAGNYQLELYDIREKAVTLSRRVTIDRGGDRRE